MNYSNGLAALSLMTNTNSFATYGEAPVTDSRAVRTAKAQFTAPASTAPWKLPAVKTPVSQQVSAIKRMTTIIDKSITATSPADRDIQTSFTTFKALDRLRLLAETSAAKTTGSAERLQLDAAFARGLTDLQNFLGQAPTDKVALAFGTATRRSDSVVVATPKTFAVDGTGVAKSRTDPLPGFSGSEVLHVDLARPGRTERVTIDLAQSAQPPTLTSIADAINAAVSAIPQLDANGAIVLDKNGAQVPKWTAQFTPTKTGDSWGLKLTVTNDTERVQLTDGGATDAVFVASGITALGAVPVTGLYRFDNAASSLDQKTLGSIAAVDSDASARAALTAPTTTIKGVTLAPTTVAGATTTEAVASDAAGNSYAVGTAAGDIGSNRTSGASDLFLTKLDSRGSIVWQRSLGASGSASGAAISLAANGDIVVAGTVTGNFDGNAADGDLVVSRFNANGDEKFSTLLRSVGADSAAAVAVGNDGSIYVGGQVSGGSGDAFLARLDAGGRLAERRTIDSGGTDAVKALAIGGDGNLLALVRTGATSTLRSFGAQSLATDMGALSLGAVDARALAVSAGGSIAVAGASTAAGDRDGFVARVDSQLTHAATTSLVTSGSDEVDSVSWLGNTIIAGGRTTGALDGARRGSVDGFVARLDGTSGAIDTLRQFGAPLSTAAPVRIAVQPGGTSKIGLLGLSSGVLNEAGSGTLVAQTSLRAGDELSLKVGTGPTIRIVIAADDTVKTLAARIAGKTGSKTAVVAGFTVKGDVLRFQASETLPIVLIAGAGGKDALAKLGIEPQRLTAPTFAKANDPKVKPGGTFSLDLTHAINLTSEKDAAAALNIIKSAITTTQGAYRSLYWDTGKAALVNGFAGGTSAASAYQKAQLAGYQAALARLTPATDTTIPTYTGF